MGQLLPDDARPTNPFMDPEKARELQKKSRQTYDAKRREEQLKRRAQAMMALGEPTSAAVEAGDSQAFSTKSNEELADMIIRRNAKILLLGGEAFAPISAKEATEIAHAWSAIAKNETVRKGKSKDEGVEDDTPAQEAAKALAKMARQLKAVQDRSKAG